ncbi:Oidioi.mRNA.OKI2018_I69.PAR.g12114.t1.cds [Oikopleura dioica]|uniref:Oidioi.mRNA.OKI2018_I69.PAR.g12114.t1.cds n=1 Tax=Oikopleura dioica TaxID=34765 RepID=A0ABN7S679_OIKDI|nr:Oidioi.mRNA.OKI2018_I69.PAR.g12114.t1.cds [Oikopleura dioica]
MYKCVRSSSSLVGKTQNVEKALTGFEHGMTRELYRSDPKLYKYRILQKSAPDLIKLQLAPETRLLSRPDQLKKGIYKPSQPAFYNFDSFENYDITDLVKPNVETDYGRSGRIDAPRSKHATKRWVKENADFQVWLKEQEGAEFIRKTPMSMLNNYEGFGVGSNGILAPDKCTEHELVFLQRSGHHSRIYTGVRHESWYNRWKVAPLAGGSKRWNQKLKLFNNIGLASVATAASLNLMPLFGLTKLAMGTPASLSAVLSMDPVVFCSLWLASHLITGALYYFQYITPLVKNIYWEPDTRCVIVELMNFMSKWNLEKRFVNKGHFPTVIKIPQKYLSREMYDVKESGNSILFDFAKQEASGSPDGSLPHNTEQFIQDVDGIYFESSRHGRCLVLKSMPLVSGTEEYLEKLPPFNLLLDHLNRRVTNANPELTPEVDLSDETTAEFYDNENFKFGPERWEFERRTLEYQNS